MRPQLGHSSGSATMAVSIVCAGLLHDAVPSTGSKHASVIQTLRVTPPIFTVPETLTRGLIGKDAHAQGKKFTRLCVSYRSCSNNIVDGQWPRASECENPGIREDTGAIARRQGGGGTAARKLGDVYRGTIRWLRPNRHPGGWGCPA
ncbi:hypothetical protein NOVOSPHI9U_420374 [Novosphingobium sp. 9U]|nr:hypothetical protein NOVOSPHI9U_420374 [Novosphingobium sp. 9U]